MVSLKKKIAQMFIVAVPLLPEEEMFDLIEDYVNKGIGGFMIGVGGKLELAETDGITNISKLKHVIAKIKALDPSLFIAIDGEGGTIFNLFQHVTALKPSREYGKHFEKTGETEQYEIDLKEYVAVMRECGINMDFAPLLDTAMNGYHGYMCQHGRVYSDQAETVMRLSGMAVQEMADNSIIAVGKHYPNYGLLNDNPHDILEAQKVKTQYDEVLLTFSHAIQANNIMAIMKGHCMSPLDSVVPASLSQRADDYLREEMGFKGLTIIDEVFMKAVREYYGGIGSDKNGRKRIVDAARVNDILLVSYPRQQSDGKIKGVPEKHNRFPRLLNAVHGAVLDGEIPQSTILTAYNRIRKHKKMIGLC